MNLLTIVTPPAFIYWLCQIIQSIFLFIFPLNLAFCQSQFNISIGASEQAGPIANNKHFIIPVKNHYPGILIDPVLNLSGSSLDSRVSIEFTKTPRVSLNSLAALRYNILFFELILDGNHNLLIPYRTLTGDIALSLRYRPFPIYSKPKPFPDKSFYLEGGFAIGNIGANFIGYKPQIQPNGDTLLTKVQATLRYPSVQGALVFKYYQLEASLGARLFFGNELLLIQGPTGLLPFLSISYIVTGHKRRSQAAD
jgi:hypothetical protein